MRYLLFFIVFSFSRQLFAQHMTSFAQFARLQTVYSPAYSANATEAELQALYRVQWAGLSNEISDNQVLAFQRPLAGIRSGLSAVVLNERIGLSRVSKFNLAYSYAIVRKSKFQLSAGCFFSLIQLNLRGDEIITPQGTYSGAEINHNDQILPNVELNGMGFTVDPGFHIKAGPWTISATLMNSLSPSVSMGESKNLIRFRPNLIASAAYSLSIGEKHQLFFRSQSLSDFNALQIVNQIAYEYNNKIITEISYRGYTKKTADAVIISAGYRWKEKFDILYSYELNTSRLRSFNSGSHELGIKYLWKMKTKEPLGRIIYNPRYL